MLLKYTYSHKTLCRSQYEFINFLNNITNVQNQKTIGIYSLEKRNRITNFS